MLSTRGFVAVRCAKGGHEHVGDVDREWLDLSTFSVLKQTAADRADALGAAIPVWASGNPVVRIVPVEVREL